MAFPPDMMEPEWMVFWMSRYISTGPDGISLASIEVGGNKIHNLFIGAVVFIEDDSALQGYVFPFGLVVVEEAIEQGVV